MQVSAWAFVKGQWTRVPPVEKGDFTGKTVVVIGANTGIGYETAKHFATMNPARLIMGCRNQAKGTKALANLQQSTGFDTAELWLIDLCNFDSVKAFVDKFEKEVERLDILVANAGVVSMKYELTQDEWETSLQVNHLAPALLIILLLPKLFKAAEISSSKPRIVIVASELHQDGKIPDKLYQVPSALEALNSKEFCRPYDHLEKYKLAKLLNVLLTLALTDHLPSRPTIIVNAINPGFCYSEIRRGMRSVFMWLFEKLIARTAEEGARQVVWGSVFTPPESEGGLDALKGAYVSLAHIMEPGDFVISEKGKEFRKILWNDTVRILSKVDPRVQTMVKQYLQR
ncbi:NAD(P)-binding protein [Pleurotus eryngii]|uniref:NAD(P)-binding protein n=1 Tax=Pleurotus eryngii TaxID=5323 RepID=A0A9P5ZQS3_PLEER|nr:NAD(P)-binding protein [Pleurotus eryngii]